MNNIQKIIREMTEDFSRQFAQGLKAVQTFEEGNPYAEGWIDCLEKYIPKLKLLLNEQPEAITGDSHFRKHDVGRSAASEEIPNKESSGESSSETQAVGQNEQTKKVCLWCGAHNVIADNISLCRPCFDKAR